LVSIIIPYTRFDGLNVCLEHVYKNCWGVKFEVVTEYDFNLMGCNPMVNILVERSKYDLVCFLHDDSEPQAGFLDKSVSEMAKFDGGYGCVGFNDLINGENGPCTHWLIHKKMIDHFKDGVFYSEQYVHTKVDMELKETCESAGRYTWAENAIILHRNPIHFKVKRDDLHRSCYNKENIDHDKKVYESRKCESNR
jgi:hypothetical protein